MTKSVPAGMAVQLAAQLSSLCNCWKVTLKDGTVKGFTDHDQDVVFGGLTYLAASGYDVTAVETSSALNVDNMEVTGMLSAPSITEEELMKGLWDHAAIENFLVDWKNPTEKINLRTGHIGEVKQERNVFSAELLGLMQAYQQQIGRVYGVDCDADLGDARCKVDLGPLTVSGAVTAVTSDRLFTDSSRTEGDAPLTAPITGISKELPAKITSVHPFLLGMYVLITGVGGMVEVNDAIALIVEVTDDGYKVNIDSTNFTAYTSGGTATQIDIGYFGGGIVTWLTGNNAGVQSEVKRFTAGAFELLVSTPYTIQVGDTYTVHPGCDRRLRTCIDKYNNVLNFRGFPYIPGMDKYSAVGQTFSGDANGPSGGGSTTPIVPRDELVVLGVPTSTTPIVVIAGDMLALEFTVPAFTPLGHKLRILQQNADMNEWQGIHAIVYHMVGGNPVQMTETTDQTIDFDIGDDPGELALQASETYQVHLTMEQWPGGGWPPLVPGSEHSLAVQLGLYATEIP